MKNRIFITFLLILTLLFAFSASAWAKSISTADMYTVKFESDSNTYHQEMSGFDYQGGYTDMTMTYQFYLDPYLKGLIEMEALEYRVQFYTKCGTSRTFSRNITVYCYDENNHLISDGQYYINEKCYIVPATSFSYESDNIKIPEKTDHIFVTAKLGCGTKQHMAVNGDMFIYKKESDSFTDNTIKTNTQFTVKEYYDKDSTEGIGLDVNYYDIFENYSSRVSSSNSLELYKKAISNGGNLYYWSQFAYDLIKMGGDDNAYIKQNNDASFDKEFGSYYFDICADMGHKTAEEIENKNVYGSSSNLTHVTSFDDVLSGVCDDLANHRAQLADSNDSSPLKGSKFEEYHYMTKDGTKNGANIIDGSSDILYTYVACTDRVGKVQKFDYNAFILAFYDFELVGVVNSETIEMSSSFVDKAPTVNAYYNDNPGVGHAETTKSWTYSESFSNSLATGNTKTSEVTHGWNVDVGVKFGGRSGSLMNKFNTEINVDLGASGNYSTSEAFSFEESKSQSETYEQSSSSSLSVDMPAYTVAEIISAESEGVSSGVYDCPIAVTYKVAVISLNGQYYDDAAGTSTFGNYSHRTKVWLFGENNNAVQDIRERGIHDSLGNSDPFDWDEFRTCSAPASSNVTDLLNGDALIDRLALNVPFTYEQATASLSGTYTTNTLKLYPCRPLYRTAISGINTNFLHRNDVIYVIPGGIYDISSNVSVDGYNDQGGEYYGFNMGLGQWSLAYFGGAEVPAEVAKLATDPATGKTVLFIGKDAMTSAKNKPIYLTYHINDDAYNYYDIHSGLTDTYAKDSDLAQKASLRIAIVVPDVLSCSGEKDCTLHKYTDSDPAAWYHKALEYAVVTGLIKGVSETKLAPDDGITRAMFSAIIYRMANEPKTDNLNPFRDVEKSDYYYDAVRWAEEQGIITGYEENIFGGERFITREEMVTILYRFANWENKKITFKEDLNIYEDADKISKFARDAFAFAVENNIVKGTSETTLDPKGLATRAQVAMITMNYFYHMNNFNQ
ncbi:MAG: S-layer homology domain-containing protein [Firmicutes bacterium]|nr:S-layer homology domain-containing protein [Bacillota bacterium]